jgi:outer membrane protein
MTKRHWTSRIGRAAASPVGGALLTALVLMGILSPPLSGQVQAQPAANGQGQVIDLTLERMVEYAMSNSYRIRQVYLDIQRTRHFLRAQQAGLKSRVFMNILAPELGSVSEPRWNSDLQRNEIIHENSRRWEAQLSVRQPVILFGYPTNGYLSLNNRMYRYLQLGEDDERDLRFYNRYFIEYEQPLFQPNVLKNNLEEAELDLESSQLDFENDVVELVDDLSDDYFNLFEDAYQGIIYDDYVANLVAAAELADQLAQSDSARALDADQIRVELANAREQAQQARSQFRLAAARVKQELRFPEGDSIILTPVIEFAPVAIEAEQALQFANTLTPRLRDLEISYRENEIRLEETRARNAFRVNVEVSYGREVQDERFRNLWSEPTNSYTVEVNAYIPIWDWGERSERVAATRIGLDQTALRMEEARTEIRSAIENEIRTMEEYESRTLAMEENLNLARSLSASNLQRYADGTIPVIDLLQNFRREVDTANNLLDAYLGWRDALLRIQEMTFYDFERDVPILDRYQIELPEGVELRSTQ